MTVALSKTISEGLRASLTWHSTVPFAKEAGSPTWDEPTSSWVRATAAGDLKELLNAPFPAQEGRAERSLAERFGEQVSVVDFAPAGNTTAAEILAGVSSPEANQAVVEAALTYANSRLHPVELHFPSVTFPYTGPFTTITHALGFNVLGHGCTLVPPEDEGRCFVLGGSGGTANNVRISDFNFAPPEEGTPPATHFFCDFVRAVGCYLSRIVVNRAAGILRVGGPYPCARTFVSDIIGSCRGDIDDLVWFDIRNGANFTMDRVIVNGNRLYDHSETLAFVRVKADRAGGLPLIELPDDPVQTYDGERYVDITVPGHGLSTDTGTGSSSGIATITGLTAGNGITAAELNITRTGVEVLDANTIRVEVFNAASASGFIGGSAGQFKDDRKPAFDTVTIRAARFQAFRAGPQVQGETLRRSGNDFTDGGTKITLVFDNAIPDLYHLNVRKNGEGYSKKNMTVTGFGTNTLQVTLSTPAVSTDLFEFRELIYGLRDVAKNGLILDLTNGPVTNLWISDSNFDHTSNAGVWVLNSAVLTEDVKGFMRNARLMNIRATCDAGNALRIELDDATDPHRSIFIVGFYGTQPAADPAAYIRTRNTRDLVLFCPTFGETRSNQGEFTRECNVEIDADNWSFIGGGLGAVIGDEDRSGSIAHVAIKITRKDARNYVISSINAAASDAHAVLVEHPTYPSRVLSLGANPLRTHAVDNDGDGETDGFSNNLTIQASNHGMRVGDRFFMAGAEEGNGLTAPMLNREWFVAVVPNDNTIRVSLRPVFEDGENPVTAAGSFGGSSITLTIYDEGYVRHTVAGDDIITTAASSATVTVEAEAHGAVTGDVALVSVTSGGDGLTADDLNGVRSVTYIDDDHFSFEAGDTASAGGVAIGGETVIELWEAPEANPNRQIIGCTPALSEAERVLRRRTRSLVSTDFMSVYSVDGRSWRATLGSILTYLSDAGTFAPIGHVGSGGAAHALASSSAAGFMSSEDYDKLTGIEAGAQVNTVESVNGQTGTVTLDADDVGAIANSLSGERLLGRHDAGSGEVQEVGLGFPFVFSSGSLATSTTGFSVLARPVSGNGPVSAVSLGAGLEFDSGTLRAARAAASDLWAAISSALLVTPAGLLAAQARQTLSISSGNIAWDVSAGWNAQVTLTENALLLNMTNVAAGMFGYLDVIQDGTGGRVLSYDTNYYLAQGGTGGSAGPTVSPLAGRTTRLHWQARSATEVVWSVAYNASQASAVNLQQGTLQAQTTVVSPASLAAHRSNITTLTDAANVAFNMNTGGPHAQVTYGGNRNHRNPVNAATGKWGFLIGRQDATGGRTPTFSANWKNTAAALAGLDTTANTYTVWLYWCLSSTEIILFRIATGLS